MLQPRVDSGAGAVGATTGPVRGGGGGTAVATPGGAADVRQAAFQASLQGMLGKTMPAEVLSRLTDGSFLVKVAETSVRMMLPAGTQVGAQVPLKLVAVDPRPTFQVDTALAPGKPAALVFPEATADELPSGRADAAAFAARQAEAEAEALGGAGQRLSTGGAAAAENAKPQSMAAMLLGKAPLIPADQLPGFDPSAPATRLSSAAQALTSVVAQAENSPGMPKAILGKTPLVADGAPDPGTLGKTLHDEVGKSGLFYESHVAEWADGKRTLPDLAREPQMQRMPQSGTDLASAQMINLQLHTHEQARVVWQGEAWPGQKMEWDITRDGGQGGQSGRQGARDGEAAPTWRSGVRFQFPSLGAVSASVVLVGDQVHIQIHTGTEGSAAALKLGAGALEQSMAAAGAPLASLSIQQDGNARRDDGKDGSDAA